MIVSTPGRNAWISPSRVIAPSGNTHTRLPAASSPSMRSNASSSSFSFSRAGAIGIALAVLNRSLSRGMSKMRWYITKRTGRRIIPPTISAST